QRRRDEMIQISNCNQSLLTGISLTPGPNQTRTYLPDTCIDIERVRYLPVIMQTTGTAASGSQTITVASTTGLFAGLIVSATNVNYWSVVTGIGSGTITISIPTTGDV